MLDWYHNDDEENIVAKPKYQICLMHGRYIPKKETKGGRTLGTCDKNCDAQIQHVLGR